MTVAEDPPCATCGHAKSRHHLMPWKIPAGWPCDDCDCDDYSGRENSMPHHRQYQACKNEGDLTPTGPDILGPFYKEGAPAWVTPDGANLTITGRVTDVNGNPVACTLDWWQADAKGVYDNEGYALRGKMELNDHYGETYTLRTVRPGDYKISDPGQPDEFRCPHIHLKVWVGGECKLTTQLYFFGAEYDGTDHWYDAKRAVPLAGGEFNVVLDV